MDPLTQLYERLRAQSPGGFIPVEPPSFDEWMKYWNDDDTELGNLRTFEHWLSRSLSRSGDTQAPAQRRQQAAG